MPMLQYHEMTEQDFVRYREVAIHHFASEKIRAGEWDDTNAIQICTEQFLKMLPDGKDTPGHVFWVLTDGVLNDDVGYLRFGDSPNGSGNAYLWDIFIFETCRRKGFGHAAIELLSNHCAQLGYAALELHVFEHNKIARRLYLKHGFRDSDKHFMIRPLNKSQNKS